MVHWICVGKILNQIFFSVFFYLSQPLIVEKLNNVKRNTVLITYVQQHCYWFADICRLIVVFGASLPSKKQNKQKTNLSELGTLWQNFLDPRMMFHILYLEEFMQKLKSKSLKLTLLLKFIYIWPFDPDLRGWGESVLAVANPIYVSNSHTKFGRLSFNGKGEDSITDCDDAIKYLEIFLFSKSLTCLPFASL